MRARTAAARLRAQAPEWGRLAARAAGGHARRGRCPVCAGPTVFVAGDEWLRESYRCVRCRSIPRQRAFVLVLGAAVPDWRAKRIHEFAPTGPGSAKLAREAPGYTASQYWPDVEPGRTRDGLRCEDLERLTFADESLDLVVTQDVFEHVLDPGRAFAEIARVLRPAGAHVFTVPYYAWKPTLVRARRSPSGDVVHHEPPDFHGDPVDPSGSLVATEWGPELVGVIERHGGLTTAVSDVLDDGRGIDGWFREVFVSRRPDARRS